MARTLIMLDSFDHWTVDYVKWPIYEARDAVVSFPSAGRTGRCFRQTFGNGGAAARLGRNLYTPRATGLLQCVMKISNFAGLTTLSDLLSIADGNDTQLTLRVESDGTVRLYRGTVQSGVLIATGGALSEGVFNLIELMWGIDAGSPNGHVLYRLNHGPIVEYLGDTQVSAVAQWTSVHVYAATASLAGQTVTLDLEDLALFGVDAVDAANFLGDRTVAPRRPNGVGNASQWTPTSGANWGTVNDDQPDGNTSGISGTTPELTDTYAMENVDAGAVIDSLQVVAYVRKTSDGAASLAPVFRIAGTDYVGDPQAVTATESYQPLLWPYDVSPATAVAFTAAEFNALESGPQIGEL